MKKSWKYYDAYFTVEASFIVPLTFLLIILMLYLGFFCYEKSISVQCCYLAALRGSNEWELSGKEFDQYVSQTLDELLEEKHLYRIEKEKNITAGIMSVEVSIDEHMSVPFSRARGDDVDGWDMNSKKTAIRNKPASYIRKYQLLKEDSVK